MPAKKQRFEVVRGPSESVLNSQYMYPKAQANPTQAVTQKARKGERESRYEGVTGWARIQPTDVIRTRLISVLLGAKMQRLEVVRGQSEFLSHFSIPQANPTQSVSGQRRGPAAAPLGGSPGCLAAVAVALAG